MVGSWALGSLLGCEGATHGAAVGLQGRMIWGRLDVPRRTPPTRLLRMLSEPLVVP